MHIGEEETKVRYYSVVESLLFVKGDPLSFKEICDVLDCSEAFVKKMMDDLIEFKNNDNKSGLKIIKIKEEDTSRHIINHWIKNYDKYLDKVITFSETQVFVHNRLKELDKVRPPVVAIPYRRALKVLERKLGKHTLVVLIKSDPEFFSELVEVVCRHGVFGWEFLEAGFGGVSVGYKSTASTG